MTPLLGAVLAGGRSSRFGSDKALATIAGKRLIDHAAEALRPWVAEIVVAGRGMDDGQAVTDWPEPGLGPLGGLCGALRHGADRGFAAILSMPCDTPFVPASVFEALSSLDRPAYIGASPVIGLWPVSLAVPLSDYLTAGSRLAVKAWAESVGAVVIDLDFPIANVNRPEDLEGLREATPRR